MEINYVSEHMPMQQAQYRSLARTNHRILHWAVGQTLNASQLDTSELAPVLMGYFAKTEASFSIKAGICRCLMEWACNESVKTAFTYTA